MNNKMNIIEAYTKFKKQYIILISGFSGSGKKKYGKFLANLFKFKYTNLSEFLYPKEIYDKDENYVTLPDGSKILDWDNIYKSINWETFNTHVEIYKVKGIVITGFGFPEEKLKFKTDIQFHLKVPKKNLLDLRHKYLEEHPDDPNNAYKGTQTEVLILNQITYPRYMELVENSKFDKIINMVMTDPNNSSNLIMRPDDDIRNEVFKYILDITKKWLDDYNKKELLEAKQDKDLPYDGHKVLTYSGKSYAYDDYYLNKKLKGYDFNDEGIDCPDYMKKRPVEEIVSTDDLTDDSSDSDMEFLFTTKK